MAHFEFRDAGDDILTAVRTGTGDLNVTADSPDRDMGVTVELTPAAASEFATFLRSQGY